MDRGFSKGLSLPEAIEGKDCVVFDTCIVFPDLPSSEGRAKYHQELDRALSEPSVMSTIPEILGELKGATLFHDNGILTRELVARRVVYPEELGEGFRVACQVVEPLAQLWGLTDGGEVYSLADAHLATLAFYQACKRNVAFLSADLKLTRFVGRVGRGRKEDLPIPFGGLEAFYLSQRKGLFYQN